MTRQVIHDGRGSLHVRFPFDRRLVDLVKTLPNRRWLGDEKLWRVPDTCVVILVDLLRAEGFHFDDTVRRLYAELGGTLDLDPMKVEVEVAPAPSRGLFDSIASEMDEATAA